jgi:hypothetical protein
MRIPPIISRIPFLNNTTNVVGEEKRKEIKKGKDEDSERKEEERLMKQLEWEELIIKPQKFERKVKKNGK